MKQLTSLEIHYLVKEFQLLINGKIDKIYQPDKKTFLLNFHVPNKGKKMLKIILPSLIFLTEYKQTIEASGQYSMFLRKYLNNARLKSIKQLESERIIELTFEKQSKFYLIIELFSKGNIILCDKDYKIINPLEIQKWKDRTIKKGEKYIYPKRSYNFFKITQPQLKEFLEKTNKDKLVTALATDLGLGGLYAEEICSIANIDKNTDPKKANSKKIINALKKLLDKKPTHSKEIDQLLLTMPDKPKTNYEKQLQKLKKIKKKQELRINEINIKIKENKAKAESIYNNYKLINEILTEIKKARTKYSWQEIKHRLKGHKIIKDINEKESKIIIEI